MQINNTGDQPEPGLSMCRYEPAMHHGKAVIFIYFEYDGKLNEELKKLTGTKWSQTKKVWYVTDNAHNRQQFGIAQAVAGKDAIARISPVNQPAFKAFIEMLRATCLNSAVVWRDVMAEQRNKQ